MKCTMEALSEWAHGDDYVYIDSDDFGFMQVRTFDDDLVLLIKKNTPQNLLCCLSSVWSTLTGALG